MIGHVHIFIRALRESAYTLSSLDVKVTAKQLLTWIYSQGLSEKLAMIKNIHLCNLSSVSLQRCDIMALISWIWLFNHDSGRHIHFDAYLQRFVS